MISVSFWLFGIAFAGYLTGSVLYIAGLIAAGSEAGGRVRSWVHHAYPVVAVATAAHGLGIIARFIGSGHWPTANMYEFMSFSAFSVALAFLIVDRLYPMPYLGALVTPIGVLMLGYASVFPREVQPLVAALQTYWLYLHVSTVSLGEGFFAVAFGAALLYLLRTRASESRLGALALEGIFGVFCTLTAYILLAFVLRNVGFAWQFPGGGASHLYHLPPIIGPFTAKIGELGTLAGIPLPLLISPNWVKGKNLNTLLFSVGAGLVLYGLLRILLRAPFRVALGRLVQGLDAEVLDEIGYRSVAIGYPIFTLGGLLFAMIWAKVAWGRYWGWDPKETWAFISWLVYSGYLHLRINRGWEGRPSAWTAALGFVVVLFTLVGVNLLIVGLHSYAGGD